MDCEGADLQTRAVVRKAHLQLSVVTVKGKSCEALRRAEEGFGYLLDASLLTSTGGLKKAFREGRGGHAFRPETPRFRHPSSPCVTPDSAVKGERRPDLLAV